LDNAVGGERFEEVKRPQMLKTVLLGEVPRHPLNDLRHAFPRHDPLKHATDRNQPVAGNSSAERPIRPGFDASRMESDHLTMTLVPFFDQAPHCEDRETLSP